MRELAQSWRKAGAQGLPAEAVTAYTRDMDQPFPKGLRAHLGTFLASLTCSGLLAWQRSAPAPTAVEVLPAPTVPATLVPAASPSPALWQVHVSGAVGRPGLVRLPPGARAAQAVAAAGGLAEAADPAAINLAAPVADGQQVHVPALGTAQPPPLPGPAFPGAAVAPAASGAAPPAADALSAVGNPAAGSAADQALVDLNQAGAADLERLPGVGPALAARILQHRQSHGPYGSPEDLLEVSGIGPKTLERFRHLLRLR